MNAQAQVLQALDAVQLALKRLQSPPVEGLADPAGMVRDAHDQLVAAPWSAVARANEAEQHGWMGDLREALRRLEEDPYGQDAERRVDEALWAANELERDLRQLVGAR
jgi:hypothetical protein